MAENIQVGLSECRFNDLILAIRRCRGYLDLIRKCAILGHALGTHPETLTKLRMSSMTFNMTLDDVLLQIFMDWANRRTEEATLLALISAFNETDLSDIGPSLEKQFVKKSKSPPPTAEQNVSATAN